MYFCLYNKKNITRWREDVNFIFSWQKQYFTNERSNILYVSVFLNIQNRCNKFFIKLKATNNIHFFANAGSRVTIRSRIRILVTRKPTNIHIGNYHPITPHYLFVLHSTWCVFIIQTGTSFPQLRHSTSGPP